MTAPRATTPPAGAVRAVVLAVLARPGLWVAALGAARRLAVPGWWRRRPHLPLPDGRLWSFRMVTAYGRPDAVPDPADVVSYLEWCRAGSARGGTPPRRGRRGPGRGRPGNRLRTGMPG